MTKVRELLSLAALAGLSTLLATASPAFVNAAVAAQVATEPRTPAEESGFQEWTSHDALLEYVETLQQLSPDMRSGIFGTSREGRSMPYMVLSRPPVATAEDAARSGKPIVVLAANVHGGERTLRESVLILARDLATPGTELNAWLDGLVVLIVPSLNPDGFEAGTRGNAWGVDLNRDYIKLEHPETAAFVGRILNRWRPHVLVDGHNGGSAPYNLNYQCTSNAAADPRLTAICDQSIFPHINQRLQARGFSAWYYERGTPTRWITGGFDVRIGRNYAGMANTIGILFESPGGQDRRTGIEAGIVAYRAVLEYVHANAEPIMELVRSAREETIRLGERAEGEIPVRMRYDPEPYTVTYQLLTGPPDARQIVTVTSDSLMKRPVPTQLRPRPYAYLLPREAVDAVEMLRRHDITVEILREPATLEVQAYTLAGITYRAEYDHAAATEVSVGDVVTITRTFPKDTYVVRTGQVLGRVAAHMLEPETQDNVIFWNTMDAWLPKPALAGPMQAGGSPGAGQAELPLIPIFKLMRPVPLPAALLE